MLSLKTRFKNVQFKVFVHQLTARFSEFLNKFYKTTSKVLLCFSALQADEAAEALDAAAVEAALSLCEENVHALSGSWATGPFQPQEAHPTVSVVVTQSSSFHRSLEGGADASLSSLYSCQENSLTVFPVELRSLPLTSSCSSKSLERCRGATPAQADAARESGEAGDPNKQALTDGSKERERENKPQQKYEKNYRGMHT